jgi:hypothetical protein
MDAQAGERGLREARVAELDRGEASFRQPSVQYRRIDVPRLL